jgi:AraC family carnitine catabolism transcriptional activator
VLTPDGTVLRLKLSTRAIKTGIIALKNAGIVVDHPATLVSLGDLSAPSALLAALGFAVIVALDHRKVPGAVIIGILAVTAVGVALGISEWKGLASLPPDPTPTFLQLDLGGALQLGLITIVFTFLFVDLFDTAGTLIGVAPRAGLLDGHRATLHWENLPAFAERYPDIEVTQELFEIDRKRITCSGGTAAIDLMLHLIAARHGQGLAIEVSEQLLHARMRSPDDHQRIAVGQRLGVRHPKLIRIVEAMENNLEEPLGLDELAAIGGISRRQLERLYRGHLGDTPTGYYLKLRLRRARQFLEQTEMSVLDVSLACGFISAPYFSRAYRALFGRAPRDDRRNFRAGEGRTGWFLTPPDGQELQ